MPDKTPTIDDYKSLLSDLIFLANSDRCSNQDITNLLLNHDSIVSIYPSSDCFCLDEDWYDDTITE